MWNKPTKKELSSIPRFYETENIALKDKIIMMHFFLAGSDWYVCEYDPKDKVFFGFAILNSDFQCAEWGYIPLKDLEEVKVGGFEVDRDLFWKQRKASRTQKICLASDWPIKNAW